MEYRRLGKTKHLAGLFSLGGESILKSEDEEDQKEARRILHHALDLGINLIDTAPLYGEGRSEERIGEIVQDGRRDEFYLATKCDKRKYKQAWKQIHESIERLHTTPDCIQIHHLDEMNEVEQIFAEDGAMKALLQAKEEGLCKYIGVTGHSDPTILLEALHRYPFDTVLGSLNIADPYSYSFQARLIPYCQKHDIGFIAMKTCARGKIFRKSRIYEMKDCLSYVWSVPGVHTAIVGITNIEQLDKNKEIAEEFTRLAPEQMSKLETTIEPYADEALFFRRHHKWPDDVEMPPSFVL